MAKGARYKKYSRRAATKTRAVSRALPFILAAVAFVVLSLVISVALGLALGKRAEKAAVAEKTDITFKEYYSGDRRVKAVDAYLYDMEYDISNIWRGLPDFSFCLREADGAIHYDPQLGFLPSDGISGGDALTEHTEYIKEYGGYVCGYMYLSSFSEGAAELDRAFELALVKKASECGVDEILLIFPEINDNNINDIEDFVNEAALSSKGAAVGVLLSPELLKKNDEGVYYASRLRALCDFAAIDLRFATADNIEETIEQNEYYIATYPLRGVFSAEAEDVAAAARELGMTSVQFVGK